MNGPAYNCSYFLNKNQAHTISKNSRRDFQGDSELNILIIDLIVN